MEGDVVDVKVLIQHPMDTGLMKDKNTGKLIPAHFIDQVVATLNGKTVIDAQWVWVLPKILSWASGSRVASPATKSLSTRLTTWATSLMARPSLPDRRAAALKTFDSSKPRGSYDMKQKLTSILVLLLLGAASLYASPAKDRSDLINTTSRNYPISSSQIMYMAHWP